MDGVSANFSVPFKLNANLQVVQCHNHACPFLSYCHVEICKILHVQLTIYCITLCRTDESRQPLSRKLPISSNQINPYRIIIILRLVVLGFFFHYRILHPVPDAYGLWLTSVICEIWFAISWVLDQFPKWYPIERETYLDRLSLRYRLSH